MQSLTTCGFQTKESKFKFV